MSFNSEVSSTRTSPLKQRVEATSNCNNSTDSSVSHDDSDHPRIDGEERHWTDTLMSLDREVSPEKTCPEGALQLHRHIENAFSSTTAIQKGNQTTEIQNGNQTTAVQNGNQTTEIQNGNHDRDGNFMEGTVCQDLLSELSRCVCKSWA
jgi:hypothetical protein